MILNKVLDSRNKSKGRGGGLETDVAESVEIQDEGVLLIPVPD
jgi:hypothetical protein